MTLCITSVWGRVGQPGALRAVISRTDPQTARSPTHHSTGRVGTASAPFAIDQMCPKLSRMRRHYFFLPPTLLTKVCRVLRGRVSAPAVLAGGREPAAGPVGQDTLTRPADPARSLRLKLKPCPAGSGAQGHSPPQPRSLVTGCPVLLGDFHRVLQHLSLK